MQISASRLTIALAIFLVTAEELIKQVFDCGLGFGERLFVDLNADFPVADLLCDFLLYGFRNIAAHIISSGFGGCVRIIAIVLNVLVVLSFAVESGFTFHGMFEHRCSHSIDIHNKSPFLRRVRRAY